MNRALVLASLAAAAAAAPAAARDPVDYVNTEMGYISHMLVPAFPTVQRPNAMMRFTPPARTATDDRVGAFDLLLTAHRGRAAFQLRPFADAPEHADAHARLTWDQQNARPYAYDVFVDSEDAAFTLVPGEKAALVQIVFEDARRAASVFLGVRDGEVTADGATVTAREKVGGKAVAYLYGEFEHAPEKAVDVAGGKALGFDARTRRVLFRYGVSYISVEQARRNLAAEDLGWRVDAVAKAGRAAWNAKLGKIEVRGGGENDRHVFYTSLWRCYERMVNITEEGRYFGWDGQVHDAAGVDQYMDDWTWDTYRAAHPLMCILEPEAESAKLVSYLRMAAETPEGWVPLFPEINGDNHCMNGFHPAPLFLDAYRNGIRGVDWAAAFKALAHTERTSTHLPWSRGPRFALDDFYDAHGYFPAIAPAPDGGWAPDPELPAWAHPYERRQAVAATLAYSYDSWCLAELAKDFGTPADVEEFTRKSRFFENLWNAKTGFFHPKDKDGRFIEIGDYRYAGGQGARDYYDENNAWTYIWDVQHDIPRLVALLGGPAAASAKLDEMFNTDFGRARWEFYRVLPDSTANMGMFTMANEPSFHIPYVYNYTGEPWKTQKLVRKLLKCWFRNDLMGVPGDEDGGGMSAFVVFSMMGFYPVTPGSGEYALGSPVFSQVAIHLPGGREFLLDAPGATADRKYVQSLKVDGNARLAPFFPVKTVLSGGEVKVEMGPRPNRAFGAARD